VKFNDLDLSIWKDLEINTDSLWVIKERDKSGKHKNMYHGNFIPQIPNQLIQRYTKQNEIVFEPFMGSGTALFECETLGRKYIGIDINPEMINYVNKQMQGSTADFKINECSALDAQHLDQVVDKEVQFVLMHPPYMDIVKFTNKKEDLSACGNIHEFIQQFKIVCENSLKHLEKNRYFAIVIGDVYKNSEVLPLGFYCMDMIKRNFKVKLKGTIIKNIEGNRGKLGTGGIWRYRALSSDYYIFKHEYIFVFKKEF
jgi:16S rRNA G966 N2-methylase RsmD